MRRFLLLLLLCAGVSALAQVTTAPSVTGVAAPQSAVAITGGTIRGAAIDSAAIGATTPSSVKATTVNATTSLQVNGTLLYSATAPTISSGFGTSPSIASNNGSAIFRVNVGTGGTASSGVVGMPTAANGWNCAVQEFAPNATALLSVTVVTASSASSVTVTNDLLSTGAAAAWQASQTLVFLCSAY